MGPDAWITAEVRAARRVHKEQLLRLVRRMEESGYIQDALTTYAVKRVPKTDSGEAFALLKLRPISLAPPVLETLRFGKRKAK